MSFNSKVVYAGDGVTTQFTVTMPYISQSHITVYVNDILNLSVMHYNFSGPSTIQFVTAPGNLDSIEFRRITSPGELLVDFVNGSVLNASDLDTAYLHNYYLTQEYADSFNEVINEALLNVASGTGIVAVDTDEVIAALVNEMLNDASAATLQQRVTDIDDNAEAIITLGDALQVQINTLASGVAAAIYIQPGEPIPGVDGIPDPITDGARWYDSDDNNAPYIYVLATLTWTDINDPRIGNNAAAITVLGVETDDNAAAIVAEALVRSNADSATASQLALIGVQNGAQTAWIIDLDTVQITDGVESLADRFTNITASWTAADVTAVGDAATYTDAEITTEQSARANADGAIATTMSLIGAENAGKTAFILDENTVKIASDGGDTFAERMTALVASDDANSASITTIQTITIPGVSDDVALVQTNLNDFESDIQAEYGVDIDVNGYITGFRIINGGTPGTSAFVIRSDTFAIVDTTGGTLTEYVPFEISGGKINMRSDVTIDGDLMVTGTINGTALINGTIGSTQIGSDSITTTHIGANQITSVKILANAITADKISVTSLAAINADIGAITAGSITMDTSGYIKGGQTAFDTGTGYFMGYEGGAYKFSIGNGTDFLTWNGTTLEVKGSVIIGEWLASDSIITNLPATGGVTAVGNGTLSAVYKKVTIDRDGTVKLKMTCSYSSAAGAIDFSDTEDPDYWSTQGGIKVYKNGVLESTIPVGDYTPHSVTYEDTVTVSAGDYIELKVYGGRFYDTSASTYRDCTYTSGTLTVNADNTITGNTINTDN